MDPITLVITAIVAGAAAAGEKVAEKVIVDTYNGLKSLIKDKLGDDNKVTGVISDLEQEPDLADAHKAVLSKRVQETKLNEDAEIVAAAQALLDKIQQQPGGPAWVQQIASGSNIAQASHGGTATVNVNQPDKE